MTVSQGSSAWLWKITARHRQPQLLEYRRAAARRWKALADAFDGDEFIGHGIGPSPAVTIERELDCGSKPHSGNVTSRVARARIWSSAMPTTPITRIAVITLVMERLFHSFHTK